MAIDTVAGLLQTVAQLPEPDRARAGARIAAAVERTAPACQAALGLLALDLVDADATDTAARLTA